MFIDFEVGSRVKVVKQNKYLSVNLIGEYGIVRNIYGKSICVSLDNMRNPNSTFGAFYFVPSELALVYENKKLNSYSEEKTMQNNITNYLNIAKIHFIDGLYTSKTTYEYANFDPDLEVGDICVVKSANHGFGVAKVDEIVEQNDIVVKREIVAKVNTDAYDERVANRAKAVELKNKMQERAKQFQEIALYKMMAENDPTMKEMLEAYQNVVGM